MLDYLISLDKQLFLFLNSFHNTFFDYVMVYTSAKYFWIPFYLILTYLIIREYKVKSTLIIAFVLLLILLSDQLSVHAFKNVFQRLRPCHTEDLKLLIHMVNNCGGQYGFVSSHATNSFALATYISGLFAGRYKWMGWLMFIWAALVSYSRVYLAQHFPADIIGGAILGIIIGMVVLILLKFTINLIWKKPTEVKPS